MEVTTIVLKVARDATTLLLTHQPIRPWRSTTNGKAPTNTYDKFTEQLYDLAYLRHAE